jgi:hypothetical protein
MKHRSLFALPAAVLALGLGGAALAAPAIGTATSPGDASLVQKVHGCHRSCELGPAGWHRHGAYCRRIACVPRAVYPNRCFVDRWGVRHCRW